MSCFPLTLQRHANRSTVASRFTKWYIESLQELPVILNLYYIRITLFSSSLSWFE